MSFDQAVVVTLNSDDHGLQLLGRPSNGLDAPFKLWPIGEDGTAGIEQSLVANPFKESHSGYGFATVPKADGLWLVVMGNHDSESSDVLLARVDGEGGMYSPSWTTLRLDSVVGEPAIAADENSGLVVWSGTSSRTIHGRAFLPGGEFAGTANLIAPTSRWVYRPVPTGKGTAVVYDTASGIYAVPVARDGTPDEPRPLLEVADMPVGGSFSLDAVSPLSDGYAVMVSFGVGTGLLGVLLVDQDSNVKEFLLAPKVTPGLLPVGDGVFDGGGTHEPVLIYHEQKGDAFALHLECLR